MRLTAAARPLLLPRTTTGCRTSPRCTAFRDSAAVRRLVLAGGDSHDDPPTLTAEQSLAFAEALERALPDIPDHDCRPAHVHYPVWAPFGELDPGNPLTLLEWFSGDDKEFIRHVIALCRRWYPRDRGAMVRASA